jgi:hypothetical protein
MTTRRDFLIGTATAGLGGIFSMAAATSAAAAETPPLDNWDQGKVIHLLPTASHDRILIKASFDRPVDAPELRVAALRVRGEKTIARGDYWQFDVAGLQPQTAYRMSLADGERRSLCEDWSLTTFPAPDVMPSRLRLLIYTCGGGHDVFNAGLPDGRIAFLPAAVRRRLLQRGLSFKPDALIADGDQIYWDLRAPRLSTLLGASASGVAYAGTFDRAQTVFGGRNEGVFLRATQPQIVPLYGALSRSTPVFFMTDDHDYFDNDEATDEAVTFPPDAFMVNLARATRRLYYPEFLPDANRPNPIGSPAGLNSTINHGSGRVDARPNSFGYQR